jgi:glucosyl-3-phosphoglycerate synthase
MKRKQIMVVFTDPTLPVEDWAQYGVHLAQPDGDVHLRALVVVPEGQSASEYAPQAQHWRTMLNPLATAHAVIEDDLHVFVDYDPLPHVISTIQTLSIDLALVQWGGQQGMTAGHSTTDWLKLLPCDLVLFSRQGVNADEPVLLALRGGPNLSLGIQAATALAPSASITLFHAADTRSDAPDLEAILRAEPAVTRTVTALGHTAKSILRESADHAMIIMGSALHPARRTQSTSILETVYEQTKLPVAVVRAWHPEKLFFHPPVLLRDSEPDVSRRVDRWFAEHSFHSDQFSDLNALLALKEKRGWSISLGLPALNEGATIANVIRTLKQSLMDDLPLVDEIILIDSDSTDNTVEQAEACGIPVYRHSEILPEWGSFRGKGEALWKSQQVLRGDIIVWVDTDITNIHPRFVYGLVGPLLKHPHLQYVKGFYRRPIQMGRKLQAVGGGRVTELVARPLFNLFFPEISGFVQPLSGEYAGRRAALEQMPFFTGYGVETGLLIDLHEQFGLNALAQSDLEVRVHGNQPLDKLSKMAFAITQVFISRLESRYGVQLLDITNRTMKLVIQENERFALEVEQIGDEERPPISTLANYRERLDAQANETG